MRATAAALAAIFLVIYLPDVGHGFISDDFRWIVESRVASFTDLTALFSKNIGFYRPITSLSFAADHALWGTSPFGYGLTNLTLCLAGAGALFLLGRRIGLAPAGALLAAGVWLLNFHAVNMAVLWLSGRTALLAFLFSSASAYAFFGRHHLLAGLCALLAMLAKEEAVALPPLFTVFVFVSERRWRATATTLPLWVAAMTYLAVRLQSGAFWPADAPDYYRFSTSPAVIVRNVLEYADRAGTIFAIVAIALVLATRVRWADVSDTERRALLFAALWVAATYALTVFLPVRSSLYALIPSAGSALALGVVGSMAQRRNPARFRKTAVAILVAAVIAIPVYRARNVRWVRLAELSMDAMRTVSTDVNGRPVGRVVLIDAPHERVNLASAFGNLLPEALQLHAGRGWTGEIVTSPAEATGGSDLEYRLVDGALRASPEAR